jgi:hypothetical protein
MNRGIFIAVEKTVVDFTTTEEGGLILLLEGLIPIGIMRILEGMISRGKRKILEE